MKEKNEAQIKMRKLERKNAFLNDENEFYKQQLGWFHHYLVDLEQSY